MFYIFPRSLTPILVYSLGIIVQTSEYFIERLSKYLLYYLDAVRALRDSVDG